MKFVSCSRHTLKRYGTTTPTSVCPPGVAALPLTGADDIEARFRELLGAELCGLARSHCDTQGAIAREATEIFGAAFTRLQALRDHDATPAIPRVFGGEPLGTARPHQNYALAI